MGHAGVSRKSPNDAPRETQSQRPSRPISAPLLMQLCCFKDSQSLLTTNVRSHLAAYRAENIYGSAEFPTLMKLVQFSAFVSQ